MTRYAFSAGCRRGGGGRDVRAAAAGGALHPDSYTHTHTHTPAALRGVGLGPGPGALLLLNSSAAQVQAAMASATEKQDEWMNPQFMERSGAHYALRHPAPPRTAARRAAAADAGRGHSDGPSCGQVPEEPSAYARFQGSDLPGRDEGDAGQPGGGGREVRG